MFDMANHEQIKVVRELTLCNYIHYIVRCEIDSFAITELARSDWQNLLSLAICNNIIMKSTV